MGVVIVTGGSRGIGADICALAAERGYSVCVNYFRTEKAAGAIVDEITKRGGRAICVQADVTIENDVVGMFEEVTSKLGQITALVNNAGWGGQHGPIETWQAEATRRLIDLNGTRLDVLSVRLSRGQSDGVSANGDPRVKGYGFQYFPHRAALDSQYPSLGVRFESANSVQAIWVVGAKFYDAGKNVHKVKRLILPHPLSTSTDYYFGSVEQQHARKMIEDITAKAKKAGADVRWHDPFLFHSLTLVDTDEPTGWAHVEFALPYGTTEMRAGYTVYRSRSREAVQELAAVFQRIWDNSKPPGDLTNVKPAIGVLTPTSDTTRARLKISGPIFLRDHSNMCHWRIKVHNDGPAVARNVQMKLRNVAPRPKYPRWQAVFPYPVLRTGLTYDAPNAEINAHDEEEYEAVIAWKSEAGAFFTGLDTKGAGGSNLTGINRDERWELEYEVTAANADPKRFSLQMWVENDSICVISKAYVW